MHVFYKSCICYAPTHTFPNTDAILVLFFPIYASMHILLYYCQISRGRKFDRHSARLIRHPALWNFVPIWSRKRKFYSFWLHMHIWYWWAQQRCLPAPAASGATFLIVVAALLFVTSEKRQRRCFCSQKTVSASALSFKQIFCRFC